MCGIDEQFLAMRWWDNQKVLLLVLRGGNIVVTKMATKKAKKKTWVTKSTNIRAILSEVASQTEKRVSGWKEKDMSEKKKSR